MADPSARSAIAAVASGFTQFEFEWPRERFDGPLGWPGYWAARTTTQGRTGEVDSVLTGRGKIGGTEAVIIAFDFRFFGGSIGEATGLRITQAFRHARSSELPVLSLIATGGSRMQEGMRSLRQLRSIAGACGELRDAGLAHIAVLRDPTTGGVWAAL